ncbi:MAG: hypothetical protein EOL92_06250 [Bacteroidia bacterium]|nr:hypothetical protein [Bacteroidia bacterium]
MPVINTTSKNLSTYKTKMFRDVVRLVENAITDVQILAMRDAPKFVNIDKKFTNKGLTGEVGVMGEMEGNHIAAYIEFGTGLSAREILAPYPQWIKDIAHEFYVNGQGKLKGKPYLYNNFLVIAEKFKRDLKELVDGQSNGD